MSNISVRDPDTMTAAERNGEFWRGTLLTGAFTAIPRWTREPVAGVGEHEARVSDELAAALRRLADELAVPLSSVLLTAHAKVLAALSGEGEVSTGYAAMEGRPPLLCRMTTELHSWRAMLLETHRAEFELLSHADFPVEDLRRELGLTRPLFETVFDPAADAGGELPEGTVLRVGIVERDGIGLQLRYRTDGLDADCAARIAGYHLTVLAFMAADPDVEHARQSLLSAEELHFQLDGLAGPRRTLPDRRVYELFEERVRAHPDAVAAVCGDRQWTYRQLNSRANQLGRALLVRGLCREGVVAVVTERNLDWMAAVLAIFKAGGVYLPIEPHFPADRIARMLSRAGCRLVLTERGSAATLDHALASLTGVRTLQIHAAYEAGHADGDLGIAVAPDQLAYIYFTSGSTGEPKGAMCEHAGMLNHMCAKIHDLGISEGAVVAQIAPQCFDISLWQLLSALLVGGRTRLVEQAAILDTGRFVDELVDGRVNVVQVVPSYLEVVLSDLAQRPRELPDLRCVSVTGEALKKELVERWFAAKPAIKLVNAYGLTETSDDTNHEVMDRVPEGERVPLGRPVNNVSVYVVDENLALVPLGAPGEIVFSGVCVGRGYINDPERTRRAYMADPHREGHRLYRSGDHGCWLPEGKLEFLGRRDTQVKISGFRIEIGEIENTLLRLPRVRDAAVVVTERADHSKRLVAFYTGQQPLDAEVLRDPLRVSLPEYMIPTAFHWRNSLPLTDNGKIDRKALKALAGELDVADQNHDRPRTATEHRLAAAWAEVLGIPGDQIGRQDHFFDLGGTSLSAVRLAIALDRAVSLNDLTAHPVLADLAALIDGRCERRSEPLQSPSGSDDAQGLAGPCAGADPAGRRSRPRRFMESAGDVRASLAVVPLGDLTRHESTTPDGEARVRGLLVDAGVLSWPLVVDADSRLILDGNHRAVVLARNFGARYALVQRVRLAAPEVRVGTWCRILEGVSGAAFDRVRRVLGLEARVPDEGLRCHYDGRVYTRRTAGAPEAHELLDTLEQELASNGHRPLTRLVQEEAIAAWLAAKDVVVLRPPVVDKATIRQLAGRALLPPKATRFLLPYRVFGLSVPLAALAGAREALLARLARERARPLLCLPAELCVDRRYPERLWQFADHRIPDRLFADEAGRRAYATALALEAGSELGGFTLSSSD